MVSGSSWKQCEHQHEQPALQTGLRPSLEPPHMCLVIRNSLPNCPSMPVRLAKCNSCQKTAWSGQASRATEMKTQLTAKEKIKKKKDSSSVNQLILLQDMPTSLSSSIRCRDQSCWGSYQCVCACVCEHRALFLSIRHYSFKSHLRIVRGLWETGLDQLLCGTYSGPCRNIKKKKKRVLRIALMFNPLSL